MSPCQSRRQQSLHHTSTHCPLFLLYSAALHGVLGAGWDLSQTKWIWERGLIVSIFFIFTFTRRYTLPLDSSITHSKTLLGLANDGYRGRRSGLLSVKHNSSLFLSPLLTFGIFGQIRWVSPPYGQTYLDRRRRWST